MATRAVRTACSPDNSASYPSAKHPREIGPDDCPEVYASICKGNCLEPVFSDGECMVFSKAEPCRAGDYVGIWLHPDIPAADELPRRVKRLRTALPLGFALPFRAAPGNEFVPIVELEQFNPPCIYRLPATEILAIHKVIGTAETNGDGTARMALPGRERPA